MFQYGYKHVLYVLYVGRRVGIIPCLLRMSLFNYFDHGQHNNRVPTQVLKVLKRS